ncbi:MAG: MBOAT family protein, partial [Clostridia bacterium]|nr:MBOAT family protein [Clostridia bacterium]
MLVCVAACYIGALLIDKVKRKGLKKLFLWLSIGVCLGILGVFKYADFFIGNVNSLTGASFALTGIILPIG